MKKLRHPIRAIREPFGTAGLIVAMIALLAALGGTALAAAKLNSTQKKEVEKIAKKFAGKPGSTGPAGQAGAAGPKGDPGAAGGAGAAGKSVAVGTASASDCPTGSPKSGVTVEVAGEPSTKKVACNGKEGKNGNPWTLGGTLPASTEPGCPCTETGTWSFSGLSSEGYGLSEISFPIPLAAAIAEANVHIFEGNTAPTGCKLTGSFIGAEPGNLCVRVTEVGLPAAKASELTSYNPETSEEGAGRTGALLVGLFAEGTTGIGTWAVTAP